MRGGQACDFMDEELIAKACATVDQKEGDEVRERKSSHDQERFHLFLQQSVLLSRQLHKDCCRERKEMSVLDQRKFLEKLPLYPEMFHPDQLTIN